VAHMTVPRKTSSMACAAQTRHRTNHCKEARGDPHPPPAGALRSAIRGELSPASQQQQRVALARALDRRAGDAGVQNKKNSDGPLSNLDANLREEIRFESRRLNDENPIPLSMSPATILRR